MSDNEHTLASLGHTEVLSVKHTPCGTALGAAADSAVAPSTCGDFGIKPGDFTKYNRKISPFATGQQAGDVLKDQPIGSDLISEPYEVEEQSGAFASQSSTTSSHAPVLAWHPSANNIGPWAVNGSHLPYVTQAQDIGVMVRQDAVALFVDFDLGDDTHTRRLEASAETLDTGKAGDDAQGFAHRVLPAVAAM